MRYIAVTALSHAGLVRDHNEDSLVVGPWTLSATETETPQTLADELRQVSVDDSPALIDGQRSTAIVTQTLGGNPEFAAVDPHIASTPLSGDARYLICTDGLTDLVPPGALGSVLTENEDEEGRAAFELWKSAMAAGGADNITLAVVRLGTKDVSVQA